MSHRSKTWVPSEHRLDESLYLPLHQIFSEYANADHEWHRDQAAAFLEYHQGDSNQQHLLNRKLDLNWFLQYMASSYADAARPPSPQNDLSWPLHSYFVSSSHNTYLTGNQLSSDCSADMYKDVLLRGCRCIEIDVWDGAEHIQGDASDGKRRLGFRGRTALKLGTWVLDNCINEKGKADAEDLKANLAKFLACEPRVLHGHTMTKEIPFRDVCETIREHAFTTSLLPLVVSLEVHCSPLQQEMMVNIMQETWSGLLIEPPEPNTESDTELDTKRESPAVSSLCNKILVKVKWHPASAMTSSASDAASTYSSDAASTHSSDAASTPASDAAKPAKIIPSLSALAIYTRGITFTSADHPSASLPSHIFSLSESKLDAVFASSAAPALFAHNTRHLMRTYPAATRVDSSNMDPSAHWRCGVQFAALNWQTLDDGMMLNDAMFATSHGFVLKPAGYRGAHPSVAPEIPAPHVVLRRFALTVIAAQNLPFPEGQDDGGDLYPYVVAKLYAPPHPLHALRRPEPLSRQTQTAAGVHPAFGGEVLEFMDVEGVAPELSFVLLHVMDERVGRDPLAAWACVRLDRLREGLRWVRLRDSRGSASGGLLLVKIEMRIEAEEMGVGGRQLNSGEWDE